MVKIVHLQHSTNSAGSAALRLQEAFIKANIDSLIISLNPDLSNKKGIIYLRKKFRLIAELDNKLQSYLLRNNIKKFGLFSFPIIGTNVAKIKEIKNADIIYIHWALKGFLSLRSIEQLAKLNKPIIFFMHDMWTITGGCHYSFECDKYKIKCNNCQVFPNTRSNDLSSKGFDKKFKLFSKYNNLYYVAPSKWLYNCAKQSSLTKNKPIFYIPNILNTTIFKPVSKNTAKQILNIAVDETVIAFGAVSVNSPYKGWTYLQTALEILGKDKSIGKILILIFGSGYDKQIEEAIPFKTKFMGYLMDEYSTPLIYNATDIFVVPSIADNQPTTVMESMCCGTPIVGFDIGGIPDMVKHKENGYLAKYKDSGDIAEGIKYCLQNNIKGYMLPEFEPDLIVKKHLELFDRIKSLQTSEKG